MVHVGVKEVIFSSVTQQCYCVVVQPHVVLCVHPITFGGYTCTCIYIICDMAHVNGFPQTHVHVQVMQFSIKSRRDKIGITRHIMMHQVLYNVHVTLFIGQLHFI